MNRQPRNKVSTTFRTKTFSGIHQCKISHLAEIISLFELVGSSKQSSIRHLMYKFITLFPLLGSISMHLMEAENKEYYLMEAEKPDFNPSIFKAENIIMGNSITLDPLQFYIYTDLVLKENFIELVNGIIDEHLSSIDVSDQVLNRRNSWDEQKKQWNDDFTDNTKNESLPVAKQKR